MRTSPSMYYSKRFNEIIWQIKCSESDQSIVLELRAEKTLEHFYCVIQLSTKQDQIVVPPKGIDWWSTLSYLIEQKLIISQFPNQTNPGPSNIYIYDFSNREISNFIAQCILDELKDGKLYGHRIDKSKMDHFSIEIASSDYKKCSLMKPVFYPDGCEDFCTVQSFLTEMGEEPVLGVEYMETGQAIVFTYYLQRQNYYERYLLMIQNEEIKLHVQLDDQMKGLATGSFMIFDHYLIYIINRKELQVYAL